MRPLLLATLLLALTAVLAGATVVPEQMAWDSRARRMVTIYLPLACFVIVLLFPFYWMTITSFKPNAELYDYKRYNPFWIGSPTLDHIKKLLFGTAPESGTSGDVVTPPITVKVPEPASMILFAAGLAGLAAKLRTAVDVPLLDGVACAISMAEALAKQKPGRAGAPPAPVESVGLSKGLAKLIGSP